MARRRDPQTGELLPEGIHPQVSDRTGKVTYRARISYGPSHHRRHLSRNFKHANAAKEWLLKTQIEIHHGEVIDPSQMTCDEFFTGWYSRGLKKWSGSRALTVRRSWEDYARPVLGQMKLQSVRLNHIQSIVDELEEMGRASSTIELYLIGIKSMFADAIEKRLININPCTGVLVVETPKKETPFWTTRQLEALLASEAEDALFPFWAFVIGVACRIGEAVAVRWEDVDLESRTVWIRRTVTRSLDGTLVIENRTKSNDEGRVITLEQWVIDALEELPRDTGRVFERLVNINRTYAMYRHLHKAADRAGLPPITPHGLRHSSATAMAVNGIEEAIVQEILGHRSRETTRRIYVHVHTESKRKGTAALAAILGQSDTTTSGPKLTVIDTSVSELRQNGDPENHKTG